MRCQLDHFIVAVPDVRAASRAVANGLGIEPAFGGAHPDHGTCNALLSLGEGRYLELIGPDPTATAPGPLARRAASVDGAEVWGFAVALGDLEALARTAPSWGLQATAPFDGSRRTAQGEVLRWRLLGLSSPELGGLVPFAIDWLDTPHPSRTAPQGARLESWHVAHPQPSAVETLYRGLGLEVSVQFGLRPAIVAVVSHGARRLTLTGRSTSLY